MTKINKKQFYVIAGLAGIIATAAIFAFPLQTSESSHLTCPEKEILLGPDGPCIAAGLCAEVDKDGLCAGVLDDGSSTSQCVKIEHWDKIIFQNNDELLKRFDPNAGTLAVETETVMDIKVKDDPLKIEKPMQKVLDKANAVWTNKDGEAITLKDLELIDIEYAVICIP